MQNTYRVFSKQTRHRKSIEKSTDRKTYPISMFKQRVLSKTQCYFDQRAISVFRRNICT